MKILLTGFNGFIGKNIRYTLEHSSHHKLIFIEKDFMNNEAWKVSLKKLVKVCDIVFHIGAISDTSLQDSTEMLKYNYLFSKELFDSAQKYNKKVIYSSSAACNGNGDGIPNNIYGWSKLITENYGMKVCDDFVSLRYFNVYGPYEEHKGKMASVAYQAYKQGTFKLFPKTPKRDFIYIKDIVSANIAAAAFPDEFRGDYFNVGSGKSYSTNDIASAVIAKNTESLGFGKVKHLSKNIEISASCAEIGKIKKALNWEPTIDVLDWVSNQ